MSKRKWRAKQGIPGSPQCPKCKAFEENPDDKDSVLVRGYKVFDEYGAWSQCLVCSGGYEVQVRREASGLVAHYVWVGKSDQNKGWFCERIKRGSPYEIDLSKISKIGRRVA